MSKKSKKASKKRQTVLIALVLILIVTNAATLAYFMYIDPSVPAEDVPLSIADVTGAGNAAYIGRLVTIIGYYVIAAGNHLLVSNPLFYFNNSLDVDNHIVVTGNVPTRMRESAGKQIAVKGILEIHDPSDGLMGTSYSSYYDVTAEITYPGIYVDELLDPYPLFDTIPHIFDPTPDKYAVLYSGGIKPGKDHYRYWNDIIYMYFILQMHGYDSDNIYVIYKDGVGEDPYTPVHYPATHTSMNTVFNTLSTEMGGADTLFFYTTNHGGSGGISVWNPMDSGGALTHSQVSTWLDSITCRNMIVVMEQCVSGKFIQYLSAPNRVIMTACKDDEGSAGCDTEGTWDEFVYHFMCALVSYSWNGDGTPVNADFNSDTQISIKEAFIWAAVKDSRSETPWYNDNGDAAGYNVLQVVYGGASYGDTVFL
ncbi:MAG: C13 family peptidase [Promethearchaeota archaeon]